MSSTGDKVKGMANEAVGNVKQGVGKATDNTRLQAEGKVQEKKVKYKKPLARPKTLSKKVSTRRDPAFDAYRKRPSADGRFCVSLNLNKEIVSKSPSRLL